MSNPARVALTWARGEAENRPPCAGRFDRSFDAGDGLPDTVETNTGVFVDLGDTGTDPLQSDTDGDGADDLREATSGTNPVDPASTPLLQTVPGLTPLGGIGVILAIGAGFARLRASRSRPGTRACRPSE